jgi:hypothetical protein
VAPLRALVAAALLTAAVAARQAVFAGDVIVVSGDLAHHAATNDLFHIGELWMQVAPNTQFHRWLSQERKRSVAVILTTSPDRYGDPDTARILTGTLMHETAPGSSPIVHVMFLQDELTGTTGPITFETGDPITARKFDAFDGHTVSVIIAFQ